MRERDDPTGDAGFQPPEDRAVLVQGRPGLGRGTPAEPRLVVDVWLAVPAVRGWRTLLLRRAPERGGFWQGVSGRVEAADRTLEVAARREIREETGLDAGVRIVDLGRWIEFDGAVSGRRFRKRSLGAILPPGTGADSIRLSDEHVAAKVVPFDEARRLVRWSMNVDELDAFETLLGNGTGEGHA